MRNSLKEYCTFHCLPSVSFEGVSLKIKCKDIVLQIVCLYRPPPSRQTKCNAQTFITEFSDLLEQYITAPGDLLITGDFNFHYDQPNSTDVSRPRTLLHDNRLRQVIHELTHQKGHTLDWLVVSEDCSLHQAGVMDLTLADHKAVVCQLPFEHPKRPKRSVTSRNLKKIDLQNFQTDVCSFAAATESKCYHSSAAEDYNSDLGNILHQHAPLTTRHVTDRPSGPWMTAELKEAKLRQRQAERRWRTTRLTVHRAIYVEERVKVHALHLTAKRQHFQTQICDCTTSKQFHAVSNQFMGNSTVLILPTDISLPEFPGAFCKFFSDKIKHIRCELDSCPTDNDFIPFDGIPLTYFRPVSEETVRDLVLKSPTKSCALDPIRTGLLKACIDSLVPLITRIVNESLESGTVCDVLKQAIVTALLKKPNLDSNMLKNYRPVSNRPFI